MADPNVIGGFTRCVVDGIPIPVKSAVTVTPGINDVSAIVGQDTVHGMKAMPTANRIEFQSSDVPGVDFAEIQAKRNATVVLEKPGGGGLVMSNASHSGPGTYTSEEGEIAVAFVGLALERF